MVRLAEEPAARVGSLEELLGVALAMEEEAVRRYMMLAEVMDHRGNPATAAMFRALADAERGHREEIASWSRDLIGAIPDPTRFAWRLPAEIASSWDELATSTQITPYKALSLAVINEERAFSYYAYFAANAGDAAVQRHAEGLAREELRHAAQLRRERRAAWRRERSAAERPPLPATITEFRAMVAGLEAEIADPGPLDDAEAVRRAIPRIERLSDIYADIAEHATDEAILREAQESLEKTVRRLVLLTDRLHMPAPHD